MVYKYKHISLFLKLSVNCTKKTMSKRQKYKCSLLILSNTKRTFVVLFKTFYFGLSKNLLLRKIHLIKALNTSYSCYILRFKWKNIFLLGQLEKFQKSSFNRFSDGFCYVKNLSLRIRVKIVNIQFKSIIKFF